MSLSSLDTAQREAQGGEGAAPEEAMLLFPFLGSVQLQDAEQNTFALNQAQRIRTAAERTTLEERRATPYAADEAFLASGDAQGHAERRTPSARDARWGGPRATQVSERGDADEVVLEAEDVSSGTDGRAAPRASARGATEERADQGIFEGAGQRASAAARVRHGRPNVDRGPAATTAVDQDVRPRDDVDAELLAARLERSLVDSSLQRSPTRGPGLGGVEHSGDGWAPRGSERGAKASPYLPGAGRAGVLDTRDARYLRWFTDQRRHVQEHLVFPQARALAKDQGVSLYRVRVLRDGRLLGAPQLLRSSGHADFDAAARYAITQAAPFDALPAALAPEAKQLLLVIPVQFDNPMVQ